MNMLRLESYLSPFLLSYLSKYIKDIEPKNLQFSLWGGDAVLHNVKFKLDALDNELFGAPFSFVSCQAQELKMYVPWNKLASEAVIVTLNTVECSLKLQCTKQHKKAPAPKEESKQAPQAQQSYIDSLMAKIKNNIKIVVNNLILKYIEDDLVLSINIQSATYQTVDNLWQPVFVDLSENNTSLRRVFEIKDMTVCLDKRGASGRVEQFEDPMLFRCHIVMRQHSSYSSQNLRKPMATKYNIMIERYDLTISETQLPAFLRLLQLSLHIYYGTILITRTQTDSHESGDQNDQNQQGWASWAWSYVPAIVNYEDLDEAIVRNPVLAFSLYIKNITINFKPSHVQDLGPMRSSHSSNSQSFLQMNAQGFSLELVAKGLEFFSCDTVIAKCSMFCSKNVAAVAKESYAIDGELGDNSVLLGYSSGSMLGFSSNSLFDFRAPENNDVECIYALTKDSYFAEASQNVPKAFIAKYLYIAADGRNQEAAEEEDFNNYLRHVKLTDVSEWNNVRERSWKTFVIGGSEGKILAGSQLVTCSVILKRWAGNHTFKSYPLATKSHVNRPETLDEMKILHFVPSRNTTFKLENLELICPALHLEPNTYKAKAFNRIDLLSKGSSTQCHMHADAISARLPCVIVTIPSTSFSMRQPMYGRHLAAYLSYFHSPPSKLMQTCNTCYSSNFDTVQLALSSVKVNPAEENDLKCHGSTVVEFKEFLAEAYALQATEYWMDRLSMLHTQLKAFLRQIAVTTSPVQIEMVLHVLDSWLHLFQRNKHVEEVLDVCFLHHVFTEEPSDRFILSFDGLILESNNTFTNIAVTSAVKDFSVLWKNAKHIMSHVCTTAGVSKDQVESSPNCDENTNWLAAYAQIPTDEAGEGCVLVHMHKLQVCIPNRLWKLASTLPKIIPKQILPVVFSANAPTEEDVQKSSEPWTQRYVAQLHCKGIHVCIASKRNSNSTASYVFQSTPGLHLCLPETSMSTSGHKRVSILTQLLTEGVPVNKYTEFGTFNITMERAEVFTVLPATLMGNHRTLHIAHAYSATCRLVVTPAKGDSTVPNVAIHLDVEPIEIKISRAQVILLVDLCTTALTTLGAIQANCMIPLMFHKTDSLEVPLSNISDAQTVTQPKDDSKSNLSALVSKEEPKQVSLTVWLQCTLSRFSVSVYTGENKKSTLTVEDVSLSLDYQNVYLKLTCCCSGCMIQHFAKINNEWQDSDGLGMLLSPIFSKLPVLVRTYNPTKSSHTKFENRETLQQRKFCEITFTQALTSDYQKHLQEDGQESLDVGNSSIVTASEITPAPTNLRQCVSELICSVQAFDFLLNPDIIADLLPVFTPVLGMFGVLQQSKRSTTSSKSKGFNLPVLYFMLAGSRFFLPSPNTKITQDDVLVLCLSKLEINPHPQNPLTRLVLAPSIYRKAGASGLLHSVGSALEDKQLEIALDDISIGTTKWSEVVAYLKQPVPYENPALKWNLTGKVGLPKDPTFHPLLQEFDFQITVAPPIWYKNKLQKWIIVCAPSFEASFASDVVLHFTKMQADAVSNLVASWTHMYLNTFMFEKIVNKDLSTKQTPDDSGLSISEASQVTEKPVISSTTNLVGDGLVATHKVKVLVYDYLFSEEGTVVKPMCMLSLCEPSLVVHVSRTQQKLEMQIHDVSVNLADYKSDQDSMLDKGLSFPINLIETKSGDCDKRTGVPPSLCTISIQHFLSSKASIQAKIGRPVKFSVQSALFMMVKDVLGFIPDKEQRSPVRSTDTPLSSIAQLPSFHLETNQMVVEIIESHKILRSALSSFRATCQNAGHKLSGSVAVTNLSVRFKSSSQCLKPILNPVTATMTFHATLVKNIQQMLFNVLLNVTPTRLSVSKHTLSEISELGHVASLWMTDLFPQKVDAPSNSLEEHNVEEKSVCMVNVDDLRTGSYTYVVANNQAPVSKQIVFSNNAELCSMAWCYDKPHAIRHVYITPIPFNNSKPETISCKLEYFNEAKAVFETVQCFHLSESEPAEFTLFTDATPFHQVTCACQWRVVIDCNEENTVSPMSLAAAMQVESVFKSQFVPNFTLQIMSDEIELSLSDGDIECFQCRVLDMDSSARLWFHSTDILCVLKSQLKCSLDVIDLTNLTWLPVLMPNQFDISLKKDIDSVDCQCLCNDVTELHVSQKIIHTFGYIQESLLKTTAIVCTKSCITFYNNTISTLVFGQALTDECVTLSPNTSSEYYWRTHKVEPKIHVSLEGVPDWNWTDSFSLGEDETFVLAIDHSHSVFVAVKKMGTVKTDVTFHGQTNIVNRLPFEMQCQLMYNDDCRKEHNTMPDHELELLSNITAIRTVALKIPKTNHEPEKLLIDDLVKTCGNTMSVFFTNVEKEQLCCLVCFHRSGPVCVLTLMPHFVVRSHLPKSAYLHVDTRSNRRNMSLKLEGCGKEVPLLELSPNTTHHLTVQLNENQSPFDAKVPIHSSLVYSMDETHDLDKPLCTLEKYYPYNTPTYPKTSASDFWAAGDGNIHANLSLYNNALLVEITPWCLIVNDTSEVICIVSKGNATSIIQPGDTAVPNHFSGPFYVRTSNSSHSQKLRLVDNVHTDHPARMTAQPGHILANSIYNIYLKKQNAVLDLTLKSCVRHGIRILTISPTWWFINRSTTVPHMIVKGFTSQQKNLLADNSNSIEINTTSAVPIIAWQVETIHHSNASNSENAAEIPEQVVPSAEETASSFICVENGNSSSELELLFADRSIAIFVNSQTAVVCVEDEFSKRLVDFRHSDKSSIQMVMTKHSQDDHYFIVLNDLVHCRYKVENLTESSICFYEITDQTGATVKNVLPPGGSMPFESYMDAESFPKCRRVYRSINLQLSVPNEENCVSVVVPDIEYSTEVDIPGIGNTEVHVSRCNGSVLVQFKNNTDTYKDSSSIPAENTGKAFNCSLNLSECKIVLLDDVSNQKVHTDIVNICLRETNLKAVSDPLSKSWYTQFSLGDFQLDNQLFLAPEFPVFFWSCQPYTLGSMDKALLIDMTLTDQLYLDSVDVHLSTVQLKLESVFATVLSSLLQSYVDSTLQTKSPRVKNNEAFGDTVHNEADAFCNPLRFTNFTIHPFVLLLSLRADVKLYVSVDRGAVSFSKFVCCDLDTTVNELLQEISRHYFADAVYGAGWILGSLDILGNPATTLRDFMRGMTDLVVLPYHGLSQGPTAFIGGVAQGVSSLLKHFSSGTLRSITNIATGISRNLGPVPDAMHQSYSDAEMNILLKRGNKRGDEEKKGYVGGIGKALVHVMTRPIGGAAGIVSKAGETILRKAGLEVYKNVRFAPSSTKASMCQSSLSKLSSRVSDQDAERAPVVVSMLPGRIASIDIAVIFVLTETQLFITRAEDEAVESSLYIKDIYMFLDSMSSTINSEHKKDILVIQRATSIALGKKSVYKEKVAEYLGVEEDLKNTEEGESRDVVKYTAEVESRSMAESFCSAFDKLKFKPNRFEW